MTALRQNFIQQMELKGRSPKTINTYVHVISKLSRFYNLSPLKISTQQIRDYLHLYAPKYSFPKTPEKDFP